MPNKYRCEICNKEIEKGNVCKKCSERIGGFIEAIKSSITKAREKQNKENHQ